MRFDRQEFIDQHHCFPRTFLKECTLSASYPSIAGEAKGDALNQFLKHSFRIDGGYNATDTLGRLELKSASIPFNFVFESDHATLSANYKSYRSFEESLLRYTRPLVDFAQMISGNGILQNLTINKKNLWVIDCNNPEKDLNQALDFIISPDRRKEMPLIVASSQQILDGIAFETKPSIPESDFKARIKISAKGEGESHLAVTLHITASYPGDVDEENFRTKARELNGLIYERFIDLISDNILELMNKEVEQ